MRFLMPFLFFFTSCTSRHISDDASTKKHSSSKARKVPCIVIDAGHGGTNHGTKSVITPHTKEKTLALQTALRVQRFLEELGYRVKMTRRTDVFIPLSDRVTFAREERAMLFVSIHFNHAPSKEAQGIEVYYFKNTKSPSRTKKSCALARAILEKTTAATGASSRGVHHGDFHVIRETTMPAVLVEGGFLSNPQEAKRLKNPRYIRILALSIARGIDEFMKKQAQ